MSESGYIRKGLNTRLAEKLNENVASGWLKHWQTEVSDDGRLLYVIQPAWSSSPQRLAAGAAMEWVTEFGAAE